MSIVTRKVVLVPVVGLSGIGLLIAGNFILDSNVSSEREEARADITPAATQQLVEVREPTPAETPFVGELLGIYFGPDQTYGLASDSCPDSPEAEFAAYTQGETEELPSPPYLPPDAWLPPTKEDSFVPLPNPGFGTCPNTGELLGAWRYYQLPSLSSGVVPYIYITRSFTPPYTNAPNFPSDMEVISIAGQPAVRIGAAEEYPSGEPRDMLLHIPRTEGEVYFHTNGVQYEQVIAVAESLIQALPAADAAAIR